MPIEEADTSLLQVWSYEPTVAGDKDRVDPFSLIVSLQDAGDERIASALDELMETIKW